MKTLLFAILIALVFVPPAEAGNCTHQTVSVNQAWNSNCSLLTVTWIINVGPALNPRRRAELFMNGINSPVPGCDTVPPKDNSQVVIDLGGGLYKYVWVITQAQYATTEKIALYAGLDPDPADYCQIYWWPNLSYVSLSECDVDPTGPGCGGSGGKYDPNN